MYRDTLRQQVTSLIEPIILQHGYELVELQLQQQKGRYFIRLYVDTSEGLSLGDCQRLSIEIGQLLDKEDVIPTAYMLEVSSPGLDRPLRTPRDFQRQHHRLVTVLLHTPFMAETRYTGRIVAVTQTDLALDRAPGPPLSIPFSHIDHGVVEIEFK